MAQAYLCRSSCGKEAATKVGRFHLFFFSLRELNPRTGRTREPAGVSKVPSVHLRLRDPFCSAGNDIRPPHSPAPSSGTPACPHW